MIKGLVIAPFGSGLVTVFAQRFLPLPICVILGIAAAGLVIYVSVFGENIYFELDDNGILRFFRMGKLKKDMDLSRIKISFQRNTATKILGNNTIKLKFVDTTGEKFEVDAGPLGTVQFNEMFAEMKKYTINDDEQN
jgi:hypothetical protein